MVDVREPVKHEQLLERRVVVLDREIDRAFGQELIAKLLFLQHEDPHDPIHLLVDSPGGSVIAGFAILDTMEQLSSPIFTYCYGRADAFAAIIVAHGAAAHRYAADTSQFSISRPRAAPSQNVSEVELSRITSMLAETIALNTGKAVDQIQEDLESGTIFYASAARAYNLVDHVVEKYPECCLDV